MSKNLPPSNVNEQYADFVEFKFETINWWQFSAFLLRNAQSIQITDSFNSATDLVSPCLKHNRLVEFGQTRQSIVEFCDGNGVQSEVEWCHFDEWLELYAHATRCFAVSLCSHRLLADIQAFMINSCCYILRYLGMRGQDMIAYLGILETFTTLKRVPEILGVVGLLTKVNILNLLTRVYSY